MAEMLYMYQAKCLS